MFDFAPVGLALTAIGFLFVAFGWRLLPRDRQGQSAWTRLWGAPYSTEATVPPTWPEALATIADLKLGGDNVKLTALITVRERRSRLLPDARVQPGDVLVLEGEQENLDRLFARVPLRPAREGKEVDKAESSEEMRSIEAVVQPGSVLVGGSAQRAKLQEEYGVGLLAVRRSGERFTDRLRDITLCAGNVLVLQAGERALPAAMKELGVLPLAERSVRLGGVRRRFSPIIILAVAMVLVAFKVVPWPWPSLELPY